MAEARPLHLPARTLWIAVLPFAVIAVSGALVHFLGISLGDVTQPAPKAGSGYSHLEAAGRLRSIAAWLALSAATLLGLVYAIRALPRFDAASRRLLTRVYLACAVGGLILVAFGFAGEANKAVANDFIREALGGPTPRFPGGTLDWIRFDLSLFRLFELLNSTQRYALALLTPALVFGAISCLAMPANPTKEDCRRQSDRLNTYLYLSAGTLVVGLVFLAAMLRWPGYGLTGPAAEAWRAHVDAYLLYWGITYSILIASYYVPIAVRLAGLGGAAAPAAPKGRKAGDGDGPPTESASAHLLAQVKALAALFAPAIAGLLGGVLSL